jgi:molybdate transport system substrate-binding protein
MLQRQYVKRWVIVLLAATFAFGVCQPTVASDQGKLTVFAAASLREAFEATALAFTAKTGIAVTFNFGGSDTLATQITQGAPTDVFASANEAQMRVVSDGGLLASAPRVFARNRLSVIVPKANPAAITGVAGLAKAGTKVVLAAPTVPVGAYARATVKRLSGNGLPATFAADVERNVVSNELDVKAVVTKIAVGEGDAGIVYSTDVTPDVASRVAVLPLPAGATPEIVYPIATIKGSANPMAARAFVDFVLADGQQFLRGRGFLAP